MNKRVAKKQKPTFSLNKTNNIIEIKYGHNFLTSIIFKKLSCFKKNNTKDNEDNINIDNDIIFGNRYASEVFPKYDKYTKTNERINVTITEILLLIFNIFFSFF